MDANRMKEIADKLVSEMNKLVMAREREIRSMIVSMFAGEHIYVGGPPGSGKTYMGKVMNSLISGTKGFAMTFNAFTTPDEVVGPLNPKEIMEGNLVRKTEGMAADCHFARFEEIFKSNPGCLGILTDILVDGVFVQGGKASKIPLIQAMATSNELPQDDSLAYLWDRFAVRFWVDYLNDRDQRKKTLCFRKGNGMPTPVCTVDEIMEIREIVKNTDVNDDLQETLLDIQEKLKREGFLISDRRMGRIQEVCHADMVVFGTDATDAALNMSDMIWNKLEDIQKTRNIVVMNANPILGIVQQQYDFIMSSHETVIAKYKEYSNKHKGSNASTLSQAKANVSIEISDIGNSCKEAFSKITNPKNSSKIAAMQKECETTIGLIEQTAFEILRGKFI